MSDLERDLMGTVAARQAMGMARPGLAYSGIEDFVLDRGTPFVSAPLTEAEHQAFLAAVEAAGGMGRVTEMKQCFANAQRVVHYDPSGLLTYAEGYAVGAAKFPMLHGWVSVGGKVVDLTWRVPNRSVPHVFGVIPVGWEYRGVTFPQVQVMENIVRTEAYQSLIDDWRGGYPLLQQPRLA